MKKINYLIIIFILGINIGYSQCTNSGSPLTATATTISSTCQNNGSITVNASFGWTDFGAPNTTGYTYSITAGPISRAAQSGNVFSALSAGTYTVRIQDCNGGFITRTAIVGGTYTALGGIPTIVQLPSYCPNRNMVKITPSGGRAPYTYTINSVPAGSNPVVKGDTLTGLTAGTCSVSITDACSSTVPTTFTASSNSGATILKLYPHFAACANAKRGNKRGAGMYLWVQYGAAPAAYDTFTYIVKLNGSEVTRRKVAGPGFAIPTDTTSNMYFNYYGLGNYVIEVYTQCNRRVIKDSFNLASGIGAGSLNTATRALKCSNFDMNVGYYHGASNGNATTGGRFNLINYPATITILSGPSKVGYSKVQMGTMEYQGQQLDSLINLSYGTYSLEVKDSCGFKDTITYTQNAPTNTANSNYTINPLNCIPVLDGYYSVNMYSLFPNTAKMPPFKISFLSGTSGLWSSYPFSINDTFYTTTTLNIPLLSGIYNVAIENGCGIKDTVLATVNDINNTHLTVASTTIVPKCGNAADVTINLTNGPCSNSNVFRIYRGNAFIVPSSSNLFSNLPAGTHRFKVLSGSALNYTSYYGIGGPTLSGMVASLPTLTPRFPMALTNGYKFTSSSIDTSKMRLWDTTFTVKIDTTLVDANVSTAFACKDISSTSAIKVSPKKTVQPVTYRYSTVSNSGPWSANSTDSLIAIPSSSIGSNIFVSVTDACGDGKTYNTTIQNLTTNTVPVCNGSGLAQFTPNPFSSGYQYGIRNLTTPSNTTFTYPTIGSVDMNNPANVGQYSLGYRFLSGSTAGCVLDSTTYILNSSPCAIVALPLHFISNLTAKQTASNNARLHFAISTDEEIYRINIYRKFGEANFIKIGEIKPNASTIEYEYNDNSIMISNETAIYYVEIITHNGKYNSNMAYVKTKSKNADIFNIYPNPASNNANIIISNDIDLNFCNIKIIDIKGAIIINKKLENYTFNWNTNNIPSGLYTVIIESNGIFQQQLVMVDK